MSNGLLYRLADRLLSRPERDFCWRYALRIILITVVFHVSTWILEGITDPVMWAKGLHLSDLSDLVYLGLLVLPYWAVFLLAGCSDENKPARPWRVWVAWLLITYPFAGLYWEMLFGNSPDAASGVGFAVIALTLLSPVFTLVGAVAGYFLWLLYRWLRTRFVAAVEENKMSSDLLGRLLKRGFSCRYALRIILITAALHAVSVTVVMIAVPPRGYQLGTVRLGIYWVGYFVLLYWAVYLLAALSDENEPAHSWRVWGAWLVITFPFAVYSLTWLFVGELTGIDALSATGRMLMPLSPVATLVGAVAGYLLWRLYQWLRTRFRRIASEPPGLISRKPGPGEHLLSCCRRPWRTS